MINKNLQFVKSILDKNNFKYCFVDNSRFSLEKNSVFFTLEGRGVDLLVNSEEVLKYSIACNCDFITKYEGYVDKVDYVIFPNRKFADYYEKHTEKNLYLGIPKYCIQFDKEAIFKKYNLDKRDRHALIIAPKIRDINKSKIENHIKSLKNLGYEVCVKARGKDSIRGLCRNYKIEKNYFEDTSWFPHDTMELISISDIVINYNSTAIKEIVMLNKPVINFDVKPKIKNTYQVYRKFTGQWLEDTKFLNFLYNFDFVKDLPAKCSESDILHAIQEVQKVEKAEYDRAINSFLFDKNKTLGCIIKHVKKELSNGSRN